MLLSELSITTDLVRKLRQWLDIGVFLYRVNVTRLLRLAWRRICQFHACHDVWWSLLCNHESPSNNSAKNRRHLGEEYACPHFLECKVTCPSLLFKAVTRKWGVFFHRFRPFSSFHSPLLLPLPLFPSPRNGPSNTAMIVGRSAAQRGWRHLLPPDTLPGL